MKIRNVTALFLAAALALAPALAEARAGGGKSFGSRGSRTFQSVPATPTAPTVRPIERRATQEQTQPTASRPAPAQPGAPSPFFQRNPFLGGLFGGLIGAGLIGLLLGHGLFDGALGFAGLLGVLLQFALIGGLAWFALNMIRRARPQSAYVGAAAPRMPFDGHVPDVKPLDLGGARRVPPAAVDEIGITDADLQSFERSLAAIQAAWSDGDFTTLGQMLTPEMLDNFTEAYEAEAARERRNRVENVRFLQGDVVESWHEDGFDYATVAMRWSALDYTVSTGDGTVIEGSGEVPVETTEVWTFARRPGGAWRLAAIQQTG